MIPISDLDDKAVEDTPELVVECPVGKAPPDLPEVSKGPPDLPDFTSFEYELPVEKNLLTRLQGLAKIGLNGGLCRWSGKSLYNLYVNSLDARNLDHALNLIGLLLGDLSTTEAGIANRIYLMGRARSLAEVKQRLGASVHNAREAEIMLNQYYSIDGAERSVMKEGISINILNQANKSDD